MLSWFYGENSKFIRASSIGWEVENIVDWGPHGGMEGKTTSQASSFTKIWEQSEGVAMYLTVSSMIDIKHKNGLPSGLICIKEITPLQIYWKH